MVAMVGPFIVQDAEVDLFKSFVGGWLANARGSNHYIPQVSPNLVKYKVLVVFKVHLINY